MQLDLTGLRIEVTDAYRDFTERKVKKLEKFFDPQTICHVTFSDKSKGKHHIDIRIEYKSRTYLAEENCEDIYYGLETLISKIEGQIRKDKTNMKKDRKEIIQSETDEIEDDIIEK